MHGGLAGRKRRDTKQSTVSTESKSHKSLLAQHKARKQDLGPQKATSANVLDAPRPGAHKAKQRYPPPTQGCATAHSNNLLAGWQ